MTPVRAKEPTKAMKLLKVELDNIFQFRGHHEFDLDAGLIGITGDNGSGKSNLVRIAFETAVGITGKPPERTITKKEKEGKVVVTFSHNDNTYVVKRTYSVSVSKKGKMTKKSTVSLSENGKQLSTSLAEVNSLLGDIIFGGKGFAREMLYSILCVNQEEITSFLFSTAGSAARTRMFEKILNGAVFKHVVDRALAHKEEVSRLLYITGEINDATVCLIRAMRRFDPSLNDVPMETMLEFGNNFYVDDMTINVEEIVSLMMAVEENNPELKDYISGLKTRGLDILSCYNDVSAYAAVRKEIHAAIRSFEGKISALDATSSEQSEEDLKRKVQEWEEYNRILDSMEKVVKDRKVATQGLESCEKEIETVSSNKIEVEMEVAEVEDKIRDKRESVALCKQILEIASKDDSDSCLFCATEVGREHLHESADKVRDRMDKATAWLKKADNALKDLKAELSSLVSRERQLDNSIYSYRNEIGKASAQIGNLKKSLSLLPDMSEYDEDYDPRSELQTLMASERERMIYENCLEIERKKCLPQFDGLISGLSKASGLGEDKVVEFLSNPDITNYCVNLQSLHNRLESYQGLVRSKVDYANAIIFERSNDACSRSMMVKFILDEIMDLFPINCTLRAAPERILAEDGIRFITNSSHIWHVDNNINCIDGLRSRAEHLSSVSMALKDRNIETIRKLETLANDLDTVYNIFGEAGVPCIIMENKCRVLADEMSRILRDMNCKFTVEAVPDFQFVAIFEDKDIPAIDLSGGEKVACSVAFRIAMANLFAPEIGLVILDEPTVWLDKKVVRGFGGRILPMLSDMARENTTQYIVPTHEECLAEYFDKNIQIQSNETCEV